MPKLSIDQVGYIMEQKTMGVSNYALSIELGVDPATVSNSIHQAQHHGFNWWKPGRREPNYRTKYQSAKVTIERLRAKVEYLEYKLSGFVDSSGNPTYY